MVTMQFYSLWPLGDRLAREEGMMSKPITHEREGTMSACMTTEHLKRCQAIAERTGGKELAAAIAKALLSRKEPTK